jgi:hypothetical protein
MISRRALRKAVVLGLACEMVFAQENSWSVRFDGVGPTKVGMNLAELNAALHEHFRMPVHREDQGCFYVKSKNHPAFAFMVEDGKLVRIDVNLPGFLTDKGAQVGNSEEQIRMAYGAEVKIQPSKYTGDEGGHYLTICSVDGKYGIRFETEKGKVTTFYAGTYATIQYVEGCE